MRGRNLFDARAVARKVRQLRQIELPAKTQRYSDVFGRDAADGILRSSARTTADNLCRRVRSARFPPVFLPKRIAGKTSGRGAGPQ